MGRKWNKAWETRVNPKEEPTAADLGQNRQIIRQGKYRLVLHLAPRGLGGFLRAKPVAKIGRKSQHIASKYLVNGRKRMPENHMYLKLRNACRLAFPHRATALQRDFFDETENL